MLGDALSFTHTHTHTHAHKIYEANIDNIEGRNSSTILLLVAQLCPTLCNPKDCNLPGSSVQGISQARILDWAAISFSRGSSRPRDQTLIFCIGRILYHQGSLMKHRVSGMKHYPSFKTTPKANIK